jgi:hypothetical protein
MLIGLAEILVIDTKERQGINENNPSSSFTTDT